MLEQNCMKMKNRFQVSQLHWLSSSIEFLFFRSHSDSFTVCCVRINSLLIGYFKITIEFHFRCVPFASNGDLSFSPFDFDACLYRLVDCILFDQPRSALYASDPMQTSILHTITHASIGMTRIKSVYFQFNRVVYFDTENQRNVSIHSLFIFVFAVAVAVVFHSFDGIFLL